MKASDVLILAVLAAATQPTPAQNTQPQSGFGTAVAVVGNDVLISEPMNQRIPGVVYVYQKDASDIWHEAQQLQADDGHMADRFGINIAADSDRILVAASRSHEARGAVYQFERSENGEWVSNEQVRPRRRAAW